MIEILDWIDCHHNTSMGIGIFIIMAIGAIGSGFKRIKYTNNKE